MPVYEYICKKCKHVFWEVVPWNERTIRCSKCGELVKPEFPLPGFKFDGVLTK